MTDRQSQLQSALGDSYTIVRELGSGGMATVYLAHDVKHDRDVAIKVLHPDLGASLGAERFLSEIRTTARLQHPHILPLLDSGNADGLLYYVMPLVTGDSLRTRLDRERQLPVTDAVRIVREVADALGYAHAQHVVHRDVKPENILLQDGHALVADFGIALAVQQAGGQRMTQTGLSLGTPQYMSPEQAMGEKHIDARSDIYSLGAVLYEMLTGDPPFTGSSVQAIVSRVMTEAPPPIHTVRPAVPASVEYAVMTALAKLPADRFGTAAAFSAALATDSAGAATGQPPQREGRTGGWRASLREPLVLGLSAAVVALLIGLIATLGILTRRESAGDSFPLRVVVALPPGSAPSGSAVLSPDGHTVVYAASSASPASKQGLNAYGAKETNLYIRRLDQLTARAIPGTPNAGMPAFSPDGKSIAAIVSRRKLVKIPLDGGPAVTLADVPDDGGVDWSADGEIVIGGGAFEELKGLYRVNARGGTLAPFTRVDTTRKEHSHEYPRVLSDGKTVLFTIWYGTVDRAELAVTSLDDGSTVVPLGILGARALGVVDGHLVYVRADGAVMAVAFDVSKRKASGTPVQVLDGVRMIGAETGYAGASLTSSGGLVYVTGAVNRKLVWVDPSGAAHDAFAEPREFTAVRLSPNGRQAAVSIGTGTGSNLWMLDPAAGTLTPLTTDGRSRNASWSPDSRRVFYASTHSGQPEFWWQAADGSAPPVSAGAPRHNPWFVDLSPDGHTSVFNAIYDGTFNLETFTVDSTHAERDVSASPVATEAYGRFSPDGRSIAYNSDESGRPEVYVRSFPDVGSRIQVSTAGGRRPIWSSDGAMLYYWQDTRLMSAKLARDPALRVVSRTPLFDGHYELDYDVSRDGARFLMIQSESVGGDLVVVPNWAAELRGLTNVRKP